MGIKYQSTKHDLSKFVIKKTKTKSLAYDFLVKAEALRISESFKDSIKHYLSSLLIDRNNPKTYFGLGISYKHIGEYEKAIKSLERVKEYSAPDEKLYYELGLCHLMNGNCCEAIENFRQTISLNKENISAQLQLAVAHECMEEYDMALLIYHTIIEKNPSFLKAYNHLSALYMNLGDFKAAGTVFSQLLKINSNFYKAYLGLAICFDKMANNNRAIHYYKAFLDKKPYSQYGEKIRKRIEKLKRQKLQNRQSYSTNVSLAVV